MPYNNTPITPSKDITGTVNLPCSSANLLLLLHHHRRHRTQLHILIDISQWLA